MKLSTLPRRGKYVNLVVEVPSSVNKYTPIIKALEELCCIIRGDKLDSQSFNRLSRAVKVAREAVAPEEK